MDRSCLNTFCDVTRLLLSGYIEKNTLQQSEVCFVLTVRKSIRENKCSMHVDYVCIHWASGHHVRIVQQLTSMLKSVNNAIRVNCMENMQYKYKFCNSCIEEIFDSNTGGFLCSNCHYDKIGRITIQVYLESSLNDILIYF